MEMEANGIYVNGTILNQGHLNTLSLSSFVFKGCVANIAFKYSAEIALSNDVNANPILQRK